MIKLIHHSQNPIVSPRGSYKTKHHQNASSCALNGEDVFCCYCSGSRTPEAKERGAQNKQIYSNKSLLISKENYLNVQVAYVLVSVLGHG